VAETTFRLRVTYGKTGRLRFLSHLEVTRACERAVRRAGLAYAVTQGFNQRMKVAFGPALPVGTAGTTEAYDVWLKRFYPPKGVLAALCAATPEDLSPIEAGYVPESAPSLAAALTIADYELVVVGAGMGPDQVRQGVEAIAADGSLTLQHKGKAKVFDLAVFLPKEPIVEAYPGGAMVRMTTRMSASGTLRPEALIAEALSRMSVHGVVATVTRTGLRPAGEDA
jgi:radical SAM-linked protein